MGSAAVRTVRIQGGLGNQLFCLAFARSVRLLTGDRVALDLSSYGADRFGAAFVLKDLAAQIDGLVTVRRPMLGNRYSSALLRSLPFPIPGYVAESPEGLSDRTLASLARPADTGRSGRHRSPMEWMHPHTIA